MQCFIGKLQAEIATKDPQIATKNTQIAAKDTQHQQDLNQATQMQGTINQLRTDMLRRTRNTSSI